MEQQTSIDGPGFPQTRWGKVYLAADRHNDEGAAALGELMSWMQA